MALDNWLKTKKRYLVIDRIYNNLFMIFFSHLILKNMAHNSI